MVNYPVAAPSLFVGLGARIITDKLGSQDNSMGYSFVLGLWQGVGLHYAFSSYPGLAPSVAIGVGIKLLIEFVLLRNTMTTSLAVLGLCSGISCADVLSRFLGGTVPSQRRVGPTAKDRSRSAHSSRKSAKKRAETPHSVIPSVLSLDTTSDLIDPKPTMTPLDREVAGLRTQASLADTERRRYKEEKKWALSQGNHARASQMSWQVKRYTALMQSFHTEADARIIAASNRRPRRNAVAQVHTSPPLQSVSEPSDIVVLPSAGQNIKVVRDEKRTRHLTSISRTRVL